MKNPIRFLLLFLVTAPQASASTFDHTEKYAFGANTGWISFRHDRPTAPAGVVFGGAFPSD